MYVAISMIEGILCFVVVLVVLLAVIAAIGWAGYIKTSAELDEMGKKLEKSEFWLSMYRKSEIIRTANEFGKEEN